MGSVNIILRRPPYGSVDASEAVRHALGGVTNDMEVKLILVDGGVNAARKGQDTGGTNYSGLEGGIVDCLDMGVEVFIDETSMKEEHLNADEIIEGVTVAAGPELSGIVSGADTVMIF